MQITGYSSNLYGWFERAKLDGRPASLAEVLQGCKEAGLDAVEINAGPAMAEGVAAAKSIGLAVSGTYLGLPLHERWETLNAERSVLPYAEILAGAGGVDFLINADPKGGWGQAQAKTVDELMRQGDNLSRIAELIAPTGARLCFHNHAATPELTDDDLRSVVEYAALSVGLCVDTGWAHTSQRDGISWVRAYPSRVVAFHLRNQFGSVPTEDLVEGEIDMAALAQAIKDIDYSGWLSMELWHRADTGAKRTMVDDVRRSIDYLRSLMG